MAKQIRVLNVLVVDDNVQARAMMKLVLNGLGVNQKYTATNGRAAQDFLGSAEEMVDLIVCDWRMPRMTGLELLQQVRTAHPDMPFMMVTGKADIDSVEAAKQYGVNAYVTNPFSPSRSKRDQGFDEVALSIAGSAQT
jgi:CheY-like chemotaxis protein